MKTYRITVSIPGYVHDQLIQHVPAGRRSEFVSRAVEERVMEQKSKEGHDVIDKFLDTQQKHPLNKTYQEIREAINTGRI